jgi:hypothetical protein
MMFDILCFLLGTAHESMRGADLAIANAAFFVKRKLRDPGSPECSLITRRRVIYVCGYDPQGPQGHAQ